MDRRDSLKVLLLAAAGAPRLLRPGSVVAQEAGFASRWERWPNGRWTGPEFWANRLQDWAVADGRVRCSVAAPNRTLHCLTHRAAAGDFTTEVDVDRVDVAAGTQGLFGFRVGVRGPYDDVRSAAVHGTGLDAGVGTDGRLRIGERVGADAPGLPPRLRLRLQVGRQAGGEGCVLRALDPESGRELAQVRAPDLAREMLKGNLALLSHVEEAGPGERGAAFARWRIGGAGIASDPDHALGPVIFAQYTLHRGTLKLTAQLAPIEDLPDAAAELWVRPEGGREWIRRGRASIDPLARTARFRVEGWESERDWDYEVRVAIPTGNGPERFAYGGRVVAEPDSHAPLKAAVFSCNADYGFPDTEVVEHVRVHQPDLCLFLGDQFYESSGGFGIQTDSVESAALDMLHKWYMFGWSYRELFRDVPAAFIPDDHDVYHGNVWGEGGKRAPTDQGWGAVAQDQGGYKMPAEWVNAVQRAQTSHLPDPVDPDPVDQGIGVYFTRWEYGGVSFAILEDRKFKSAPANVLPAEAQVVNGWIQNPEFDVRAHPDPARGHLLGQRQLRFLERWVEDWSGGSFLKVVLSQTNFAAVHTIPAEATSGAVLPSLPVPVPGQVVTGDKLAVDMDSNGWPRARRDEALRLMRRAAAFHIAGDQHLATMVRHGIDDFDDAGFSFTGPALNNLWPRRWWPPRADRVGPLDDPAPSPDDVSASYTGRYLDGFGNRITVHAAANPTDTGLEPVILRNRATGYGIVTFEPRDGRIRVECWPRHVDPNADPEGQFSGWPMTIRREEGDGRTPNRRVDVRVEGLEEFVVQLRDAGGRTLYARRFVGGTASIPLVDPETSTIRVGDPDRSFWQARTLPAGGEPLRLFFRS